MKLRRLAAPLTAIALTATLAACGSDDDSAASDSVAVTETADASSTGEVTLNAADVEFAQGMIAHHEQAIEMAEIALDPATGASPEVVDLADTHPGRAGSRGRTHDQLADRCR